ncbi:MAG: hypothetical protein GY715_05540, partial [Planctomycetes bacterium]|nr:hypothetical protein [Planctomycetota bacterium]
MTRTLVLVGIGATTMLSVAPDASAQIAKFEVLTEANVAMDLSPDGKWIVGHSSTGGGYIWSRETGYNVIGGQGASAVSDDGTVVLGDIDDPLGIGSNVAGMWTAAEGWFSLGALPNAGGCPSRSDGYELSADGSIAVGLSWDGCSGRGFRWTQATGMLEQESLGNGSNRTSVISADGALTGGFAQGSFSRTPAIWDADTMGALLDPGPENIVGEVLGIRDDGSVLLGYWDGKAFKLEEGQPIELFSGPIAAWTG